MEMKLSLFFSRGISLDIWKNSGLLHRELTPYKRMLSKFDAVSFITYGKGSEKVCLQGEDDFEVLSNRWGLPTDLYAILCPILYRDELIHADIYKTNQINGWWTAGLAKFLYGKPLVVRCGYLLSLDQERKGYFGLRKNFVSLIESLAFRCADASIVTTPRMKEEVIRRYNLPHDRINVIPSPIDIDLFRPLPDIKKVEGRLGFVGRFSPEKNIRLLMEALSGIENASLLLMGDGESRAELESFSSRIKINATFTGNVPNDNIPAWLNTCEAFILPSSWEGMPKALLEAMSCGLPVIGTDVPGIRDIIEHKINGFLCKLSVEDLRAAIRTVLGDPLLRKRIGAEAREYVAQNYTIEKSVSMELELMSSLMDY
jgi:glycosyltransferase involved in cell wall biosynthesis